MSNHRKAIVPIETWCYNSPELKFRNQIIDLGLFAESLIYYDQSLINISSPSQLIELVKWFLSQKKFPLLLSLIRSNVIELYEFSFASTAAEVNGDKLHFFNIETDSQKEKDSFIKRYLYNPLFLKEINNSKRFALIKSLENSITEIKAKEYGETLNDTKFDIINPKRNALIVQSLVDDIFPIINMNVPEVTCEIKTNELQEINMTYNLDFNLLTDKFGKQLNFNRSTPINGAITSNRLIWASSRENCDLYLGNPIGSLVGDKLFEIGHNSGKPKEIIENLRQEVAFPDIRNLVNSGKMGIEDVMKIRKQAKRFRSWIQSESEKDRNAIFAYHNEVGKEIGIIKHGRKILNLFGTFGGPILGTAVGASSGDGSTAVLGATIGTGVSFLTQEISKYNKEWKPIVFGNWLDKRISKVLK